MNKYLKRMIIANTQLKEIGKITEIEHLDPFLYSEDYCIRIGAIRRYEELTGTVFPGKTEKETSFINQVNSFNSWSTGDKNE
jgi:hypothetical protein